MSDEDVVRRRSHMVEFKPENGQGVETQELEVEVRRMMKVGWRLVDSERQWYCRRSEPSFLSTQGLQACDELPIAVVPIEGGSSYGCVPDKSSLGTISR